MDENSTVRNKDLEGRALEPPDRVFEGESCTIEHPYTFFIENMTPLAQDYLFARGRYEPLSKTTTELKRAQTLVGHELGILDRVFEVTEKEIRVMGFNMY